MKIKDYMEKHDHDDSDLAEAIGVTKQMARLWRCNACSPRLIHALKIYKLSKGKVSFEEMLTSNDLRSLQDGN